RTSGPEGPDGAGPDFVSTSSVPTYPTPCGVPAEGHSARVRSPPNSFCSAGLGRRPVRRRYPALIAGRGPLAAPAAKEGIRAPVPAPSALRPLAAVLRPPLPAIVEAGAFQRAANHVVADPGQILLAAAADQDDGVLLQVVPLAADIARD